MAPFAFDLLDEEEKKKAEDQGAAPAMTGGGSSFAEGSAQPAQGQGASAKGVSKQGSGFVGLDRYMKANQGSGFGGQFTGKVQGELDSAKQGLSQGAQDFSQASNQGTTRWNDVGDSVKGIVDSAGDQTTKDDASKIQGLASAQYQGPDNFLGTAYGAQANGAMSKASQGARALQSEGGRFALLDQYFGRPKYNMGEKSLDNLLVQNDKGVAARSQSIGGQAKQTAGQFNDTVQGLDNMAAANRQATTEAAKNTQDYLGSAKSGLETDLQKRYQDYGSGLDAYNQGRQQDIADDQLDDDTLAASGLGEGQHLYDVNLANYLRESPKASLGQFASDQDYSKYLALSQLAGEDPSLLSAADRAKAGSGAGMGKVSFDKEALQRDVNDATSRVGNAITDYAAHNFPPALAKQMPDDKTKVLDGSWLQSVIADRQAKLRNADNIQAKSLLEGEISQAQGALQDMAKLRAQYGYDRMVSKAGG